MITFPTKQEVDRNKTINTLGDLIKQINDIETLWNVCSESLSIYIR